MRRNPVMPLFIMQKIGVLETARWTRDFKKVLPS